MAVLVFTLLTVAIFAVLGVVQRLVERLWAVRAVAAAITDQFKARIKAVRQLRAT